MIDYRTLPPEERQLLAHFCRLWEEGGWDKPIQIVGGGSEDGALYDADPTIREWWESLSEADKAAVWPDD